MRGSDGACVRRGSVPERSPELVTNKRFITGSECPEGEMIILERKRACTWLQR